MPKSDSDVETLHQALLDSFDRCKELSGRAIVLSDLLEDCNLQLQDALIEYRHLSDQYAHSLLQS